MKTMCPPVYRHNGFVATHAHLASVRFEHCVCRGSLMTTYIYIQFLGNQIVLKCIRSTFA